MRNETTRNPFTRRLTFLILTALCCVAAGHAAAEGQSRLDSLRARPKIDAHAHIFGVPAGQDSLLVGMLKSQNMKWLDICTFALNEPGFEQQVLLAKKFHAQHPQQVAWAVSFPLDGWGQPGWTDRALGTIRDGFAAGAVAVKVWKDFGMVLRDPDSNFVRVDDPRLDTLFAVIQSQGHTLVAHIGEPRNCWLPLDSMTVEGDRSYYRDNPQYHGYGLPGIPGYAVHVAARDNLLARRAGLRVVGCHLGSLEYDVDSLALRLEQYPNFAVDLAGRIVHLQVQDREKVRRFVLRYQDRILYGTDNLVGDNSQPLGAQLEHFERVYDSDYRYFATDEEIEAPEVRAGYVCRGLDLPLEVLDKIFYSNAVRWYPGI
ncbi:amidohydrolase [bacterium]|nr:amidohydrolase [bacterium]